MRKDQADELLNELHEYVHSTYGEHYAIDNKIQVTDFIMSQFEDGGDFLRGNALKYLSRWGRKEGKNRKDLLKALHYIILMLHHEDQREQNNKNQPIPEKPIQN